MSSLPQHLISVVIQALLQKCNCADKITILYDNDTIGNLITIGDFMKLYINSLSSPLIVAVGYVDHMWICKRYSKVSGKIVNCNHFKISGNEQMLKNFIEFAEYQRGNKINTCIINRIVPNTNGRHTFRHMENLFAYLTGVDCVAVAHIEFDKSHIEVVVDDAEYGRTNLYCEDCN